MGEIPIVRTPEKAGLKLFDISMEVRGNPANCLLSLGNPEGRSLRFELDMSPDHPVITISKRPKTYPIPNIGNYAPLPDEIWRDINTIMLDGSLGTGWFDWGQIIPTMTRRRIVWTSNPPGHQDRLFKLAGFGFGHYWKNQEGGAETFIVFKPPVQDPNYDAKYVYDLLRQELGEPVGGTTYIRQDGNEYNVRNEEPIGAYALSSLRRKVGNTLYVRSLGIQGIEIPQIHDVRGYVTGWRGGMGMYVASIPLAIPSHLIVALSKSPLIGELGFYPSKSYLYGMWIAESMRGLGLLHQAGLIHNQYHPGNKLKAVDGSNNLVMTDFATLQFAGELDNTKFIPEADVTVRQWAIWSDAVHALELDIGLFFEGYDIPNIVHLPAINDPNAIVETTLELCAWAVYGYDTANVGIPSFRQLNETKNKLRNLVRQFYPSFFDHSYVVKNKRAVIQGIVGVALLLPIRAQFPVEIERGDIPDKSPRDRVRQRKLPSRGKRKKKRKRR